MYVIAIIPARSGSKTIQHKNIKELAGRPLLAFSIVVAQRAKLVDRTIVSTDSADYALIAKQYGAEVPFLRPSKFATDMSTDYSFIKHLLDWLESVEHCQPDYLVHLRPTTPLRDPKVVDEAIRSLHLDPDAISLRSVHVMSQSAYKVFEISGQYLKCVGIESFNSDKSNQPRQQYPVTYDANGYVDVLRPSFILENGCIHGTRTKPFITEVVPDIDTAEDFEYLRYRCNNIRSYINQLFKGSCSL